MYMYGLATSPGRLAAKRGKKSCLHEPELPGHNKLLKFSLPRCWPRSALLSPKTESGNYNETKYHFFNEPRSHWMVMAYNERRKQTNMVIIIKLPAQVGYSLTFYRKIVNPSSQVNPSHENSSLARGVDLGWKVFSCKPLQKIDCRRVTRCGDLSRVSNQPWVM